MTLITGTIKDSGGSPIASGILRVKLDAPLIDTSTNPDSLHTQEPREFTITNGALPTINLPESETQQVTYEFTLYSTATVYEFYFADGTRYDGPTHLHTDSKWYTGYSHRAESVELDRVAVTERTQIDQFNAIVPNQSSEEYTKLLPARISTDTLPATIRQIADLLTTTPAYRNQLRGGPNPKGTYSSTTYYALDDQVELDGSSYIYINPITTAGNQPPNTTYWQLLAARGATGTGTTGNNTPYNATTWDGQLDAPSRNAVRDVIETLAKLSDIAALAPLASPNFSGNPSRSTAPLLSDNSQQIPTTNWVRSYAAPIDSPSFTNNPAAPTQAVTDISNKLATCAHVTNKINALGIGTLVVASQTSNVTLTSGSWIKIPWNVEEYDPNNLFNNGTFTPAATDWYEFTGVFFGSATSITASDVSLYELTGGTRVQNLGLGSSFVLANSFVQLTAGIGYDVRWRLDGGTPAATPSSLNPTRLLIRRLKV